MSRSEGRVVGVRVSCELTHTDYREIWVPALENSLAEHGTVRALLFMDDTFQGWESAAVQHDSEFRQSHGWAFQRCALVAERHWLDWSAKVLSLVAAHVRCFDLDQIEAAWDWLEDE